MHVMPDIRGSYQPHSVSGYCIGTSFKHYRCYKIWVKDTHSVQIGNTVFFKHKYLTMPTTTNADALLKAAKDMSTAIKGGVAQTLDASDAIDTLMDIFQKNAEAAKAKENAAKPQRVRMREAAERSIALEREHATAQRVEEEQPIGDITPNEPGINSPPNAATEVKDTPATNTRSKRKKTTSIAQEAMFAAIDISRSTKVTPSRLASRKFCHVHLQEQYWIVQQVK